MNVNYNMIDIVVVCHAEFSNPRFGKARARARCCFNVYKESSSHLSASLPLFLIPLSFQPGIS